MAHWETITHALHRAGGGPLPRSAFDADIECDESVKSGLKRAKEHGLVTSFGAYGKATWTLTQLGLDWCMGRVALVSRSWLRVEETDEARQKRIARLVADSAEAFETCARLTPRKREVLVLIAKGFTRCEMAVRLGIEPCSVTTRIVSLYKAIGCNRSEEAAVIAAKAGIA